MPIVVTEEVREFLCNRVLTALRKATAELELEEVTDAATSRYVVRAETDTGPLYLRSITGSLTEWTSEQKYAQRCTLEETREHRDSAFCPDARSFHVRKLRPSPGYHVTRCDGMKYVWGDADDTYDSAYTSYFARRTVFKTKKAAQDWIDARVEGGHSNGSDLRIVPESPVPAPGASPQ